MPLRGKVYVKLGLILLAQSYAHRREHYSMNNPQPAGEQDHQPSGRGSPAQECGPHSLRVMSTVLMKEGKAVWLGDSGPGWFAGGSHRVGHVAAFHTSNGSGPTSGASRRCQSNSVTYILQPPTASEWHRGGPGRGNAAGEDGQIKPGSRRFFKNRDKYINPDFGGNTLAAGGGEGNG